MKGIHKAIFSVFALAAVVLGAASLSMADSQVTAANWTVTWHDCKDSLSYHSCLVDIQNLDKDSKRDFNLTVLFDNTSFKIENISGVSLYEWKAIVVQVPDGRLVYKNCSVYQANISANVSYACDYINQTLISKSKNDWKPSKMQMFKKGSQLKSNYGSINIEKYGSKIKTDDFNQTETINGTKYFKIDWSTSIQKTAAGFGSAGKIAFYEEAAKQEFHPVWNTTWNTTRLLTVYDWDRANIQIPFNISYYPGMDPNGADIRFSNLANNTEYYYWMEAYSASEWYYIWVNTTTPEGALRMYYGANGVGNVGKGNRTFSFFDDFSGSTDESPHTYGNVGCDSITESGGDLLIDVNAGADCYASIAATEPSVNITLSVKAKTDYSRQSAWYIGTGDPFSAADSGLTYGENAGKLQGFVGWGTFTPQWATTFYSSGYHILKFESYSDTQRVYSDWVNGANGTSSWSTATLSGISFAVFNVDGIENIDYAFLASTSNVSYSIGDAEGMPAAPPVNHAPAWSNPVNATSGTTVYVNTTWTDDTDAVGFNYTILEANFTGSFLNYTNSTTYGNVSFYNNSISNSGTYAWKMYANDSANLWNVTDLFYLEYQAPTFVGISDLNFTAPANYSQIITNFSVKAITNSEPVININSVILESNYTGSLVNHTMSAAGGNYYNFSDILPAGTFSYKFYAVSTSGVRNETAVATFIIEKNVTAQVLLYLNNSAGNMTCTYPCVSNASSNNSIGLAPYISLNNLFNSYVAPDFSSVDIGDVRGDGIQRIIVRINQSGAMFEYTHSGSNWNRLFINMAILSLRVGDLYNNGTISVITNNYGLFTWNVTQYLDSGKGMWSQAWYSITDARGDGIQRLYAAGEDWGIVEEEWNHTNQSFGEYTVTDSGVAYDFITGDGRSDNITRLYRFYKASVSNSDCKVEEWSYNSSGWYNTQIFAEISIGGTNPCVETIGIEIGQGRDDGINRFYVAYGERGNYIFNLTEWTYNASSNKFELTSVMDSFSINNVVDKGYQIAAGKLHNDGIDRVYILPYNMSSLSEYSWNGTAYHKVDYPLPEIVSPITPTRSARFGYTHNDGVIRMVTDIGDEFSFVNPIALYRNGSLVTNPEIATLPVGSYNYTAVMDAQNYTAGSVTYWLNVENLPNTAPRWSDPLNTTHIGTVHINTNWTDDLDADGYNSTILESNFTGAFLNYSNFVRTGNTSYYSRSSLSNGAYSWRMYANDSSNLFNVTPYFDFNMMSPILFDNPHVLAPSNYSLTATYFTVDHINATCGNISTGWLESNYTGTWTNYSLVNYDPTEDYVFGDILPAGTFGYNFLANDTCGNWNQTENFTFTINQAANIAKLYLNNSQANMTCTYPCTSNATATALNGTAVLYQDSTAVTNPELAQLAAGLYNYTAVSYGDANYTSQSMTWWLDITKGVAGVKLYTNNVQGNQTIHAGQFNFTAVSNVSSVTVALSLDETYFGYRFYNATGTATNLTNITFATIENITAETIGTTNYTGTSVWYEITIYTQPRFWMDLPTFHPNSSEQTRTYDASYTDWFNLTINDTLPEFIDTAILEIDSVNYTLQNQSQVYYYNTTGLAAGAHSLLWFANNTGGSWNVSQLFYLTISSNGTTPTPPPGGGGGGVLNFPSVCGNKICEYPENASTCPLDCKIVSVFPDSFNYTAYPGLYIPDAFRVQTISPINVSLTSVKIKDNSYAWVLPVSQIINGTGYLGFAVNVPDDVEEGTYNMNLSITAPFYQKMVPVTVLVESNDLWHRILAFLFTNYTLGNGNVIQPYLYVLIFLIILTVFLLLWRLWKWSKKPKRVP